MNPVSAIKHLCLTAAFVCTLTPPAQSQMASAPMPAVTSTAAGVLSAAEVGKLLPETVYFQGKSAPVQARNSGGVRFSAEASVLVALVDASGYSSAIQEKYQAYLIAETPILVGGHPLPAGAYGCGFVAGGNFLVMDIGGHTLFTVPSMRDTEMRRPTPLQVLAAPAAGEYRLYEGRNYVGFAAAQP